VTASFLNEFPVSNTCIIAPGKRQKRSLFSRFPVLKNNLTKQVSYLSRFAIEEVQFKGRNEKLNLDKKFNFDRNQRLIFLLTQLSVF